MAKKHKDGISRELLDELIAEREARGALDFGPLATESRKALAQRMQAAQKPRSAPKSAARFAATRPMSPTIGRSDIRRFP